MTEVNHTPAPWRVANGIARLYIEDANGEEIAQISQRGFYNTGANANLIALAPKMHDFIGRLVNADSHTTFLNMMQEGSTLLEELK
jgi:hypothetical protein